MRPESIVLIDDDHDDREIFLDAVIDLGYGSEASSFESAKDFFEEVEDLVRRTYVHLFLDINMPMVSGFECLERIRGTYGKDKIHIVMYSTSSSEKDISTSFDRGADEFMVKPSEFRLLKDAISDVIGTFKSRNLKLV